MDAVPLSVEIRMTKMPVTRVRAAALALFAVAALALAFGVSTSAQTSAAPVKEVRIAFQKGTINLSLLKQRGTLEKRLPQYRVTWIEFPAGPQLLEALAVGSADIGAVGDTPPIFAQAAGRDLVYVGVESPKPESSAILVARDSPIRTLGDLKGRKVAFQKGSSAHFLTVRALESAGIAYRDIEAVYLAPAEARAAFERGAVDAWTIWDPYYAAAELQASTRVLATSRGLTNNNSFYLASRSFADANRELIGLLFDELDRTDAFLHEHRKEAVALYAAFAGLEPAVVEAAFARRPREDMAALTNASIADQQRVADTFYRLWLIPKAINVAEIVWQGQSLRVSRQ